MNRITVLSVVVLLLMLAGCGGSSDETSTAADHRTTETAPDSATVMRNAVERALAENLAVSRRALWTNEVPLSARSSTRGAALIEMRRSAAERRRDGVRVRVVEPRLRIDAIDIDPSYERATARIVLRDRLRIAARGRRPRVEQADARARVELRRVGDEPPHFVVWQVTVAR